MITLPQYTGKNIAVFGLGKTGISVVKTLLNSGANIYAWDDNKIPNINKIKFTPPSTYNWSTMDLLILSPGIPLKFPTPHSVVLMAEKAGCKIISDIDLLYEARPDSTFIGITGTNGKSTTSSLIHHILQENNIKSSLGGNYGISALETAADADIYVLEMSSYQLDLSQHIKFNISILLNITPDHLDRHGNMENYISAKKKIFSENGIAVIGIDNKASKIIGDELENRLAFSAECILQDGFSLLDNKLYKDGKMIASIPNKNIIPENIAAAYATCSMLGLGNDDIMQAIATFKNLPHRMELVAVFDNITFINDSKATNAEATQQALSKYQNIYWLLGGRAKKDGIKGLDLKNVKQVFLIGEAIEEFAHTLCHELDYQNYTKSYTLQQALQQAYNMALNAAQPIIILLSPACSSFDQWSNFEARGDAFKRMVQEII